MGNFYYGVAAMVAIISTSASAANVMRDGFFFSPYVGANYVYYHFTDTPTGIEDNYNGGDVHVGARIHQNFGLEAGYFRTETGKNSDSGVPVESRFQGANIDLMLYSPITPQFELIGSVGANYTEARVDVAGFGSAGGDDWDPRYGFGVQYWLTDNINARTMVHYIQDNNDGSDVIAPSVGLNIQF